MTLCRKYNPQGYLMSCREFLLMGVAALDAGYSVPLRLRAWESGHEDLALSYLTSEQIQSEIAAVFDAAEATSLDVERKNSVDKKSDGARKVLGLQSASRNGFIQRYRRRRLRTLREHVAQERTASKTSTINVRALAVKERPDLLSIKAAQRNSQRTLSSIGRD